MAVASQGGVKVMSSRTILLQALALGLLCGQCRAADKHKVQLGTAKLPGEAHYYTHLLMMHARDGQLLRKVDGGKKLHADFRPVDRDYELHINDPNLEETAITLELDLPKYNLMYTPVIYNQSDKVTYNPLEEITVMINLTDTPGPVDKVVDIKVADPKNAGNWLYEVSTTYHVHVTQDANAQAVQLLELKITDSKGNELKSYPDFAIDTAARKVHEYKFLIDHDETSITVRASCPDIPGASKEYNGEKVHVSAEKTLDVAGEFLTNLDVMCKYSDKRVHETTNEVLLTFQKKVKRTEASKFLKSVEALPEYGWCKTTEMEEGHEPPEGVEEGPGFVCRIDREHAELIAQYKSKTGFGILKGAEGRGADRLAKPLNNDLPAYVSVQKGSREHFKLQIDVGMMNRDNTSVKFVEHPITIIWPAHCHTLTCPDGLSWKHFDKFIAREHMCMSETCDDHDTEHCCAIPRVCATYRYTCPDKFELRPGAEDVNCHADICTKEDDEATCCMESKLIDPPPKRVIVNITVGMTVWIDDHKYKLLEGPFKHQMWRAETKDIQGEHKIERMIKLQQGVIVLLVGKQYSKKKGWKKGYISAPLYRNGTFQVTLFHKSSAFDKGDKVVVYGTNATVFDGPNQEGFYVVKYGDNMTSFPMPEFVMKKRYEPIAEDTHTGGNLTHGAKYQVGQQVTVHGRVAVVIYSDQHGDYRVNFADNSEQSGIVNESVVMSLTKLQLERLDQIHGSAGEPEEQRARPVLGILAGAVATGMGVLLAASVRCGFRSFRAVRTARGDGRYSELMLDASEERI